MSDNDVSNEEAPAEPLAKGESAPAVNLETLGNSDLSAEARTVESRSPIRDQLADDIAAFLQRGGSIDQIDPDVTADPPKKPQSNYGSRAI